jgi:hypothetical protein
LHPNLLSKNNKFLSKNYDAILSLYLVAMTAMAGWLQFTKPTPQNFTIQDNCSRLAFINL